MATEEHFLFLVTFLFLSYLQMPRYSPRVSPSSISMTGILFLAASPFTSLTQLSSVQFLARMTYLALTFSSLFSMALQTSWRPLASRESVLHVWMILLRAASQSATGTSVVMWITNIQYNIQQFLFYFISSMHSLDAPPLLPPSPPPAHLQLFTANTIQLSLLDSTLNSNFITLQHHIDRIYSQIATLSRTSAAMLQVVDPFQELIAPEHHSILIPHTSAPTQNVSESQQMEIMQPRIIQERAGSESGQQQSRNMIQRVKKTENQLEALLSSKQEQDKIIQRLLADYQKVRKILRIKPSSTQSPQSSGSPHAGGADEHQKTRTHRHKKDGANDGKQLGQDQQMGQGNHQEDNWSAEDDGFSFMQKLEKGMHELKDYSKAKFTWIEQLLEAQLVETAKLMEMKERLERQNSDGESNDQNPRSERAFEGFMMNNGGASPSNDIKKTKKKDRIDSLNDTVESYKNLYEDKIVSLFQELESLRNEYVSISEKIQQDRDQTIFKSISNRGQEQDIQLIKLKAQGCPDDKLRKQVQYLKRELRKHKEEFSELIGGVNAGTNEKRTLIIKPNETKEDWKQLSNKIYKSKQEVLAQVRELETKVSVNSDITIILQELEVSISECKILLTKKVNQQDFDKNLRRLESRLNSFMKQMCERDGAEDEQDSMIVKQPWFCLSCDSEIKNFPKMNKTLHVQKPIGKKVNPESHMVRRPDAARLPSLH